MSIVAVDSLTDEVGTGSPVFPNGTPGFPLISSDLPAGSVIQVVNGSTSTQITSTSTSYIDTTLTASITPTSADNDILVFANQVGIYDRSGNSQIAFRLVKDGVEIIVFESLAGYDDGGNNIAVGGVSVSHLDSPSTTSSVTYKTQVKDAGGGNQFRINTSNGQSTKSTITLMEIAG